MPNKDLTEIVVILDRSGSMNSVRKDAVGGFNAFIEKQAKLPGQANVTMVLFDHEYQVLQLGTDIQSVEFLTEETYVPRGSTALFDAIGRTFNEVGARFAKMSEGDRPDKVIAVIITDGMENASMEFNGSQIGSMIKHQREKYNWEVLFIGSDEKSMQGAGRIGISTTRGIGGQSVSASYAVGDFNANNVETMYATMGMAVANYRSAGTVGDWTNGEDLTKKEKKEAK